MFRKGEHPETAGSSQRGTALLLVLVMVTVLGLAAAKAGQTWRATVQRAREAELLWRGRQYQQAIESYYNVRRGATQMYPPKLEDLVRDPRFPGVVRHLRRLYDDPMTNGDWEVLRDPAERIIGVRSSSTLEPFQKDGFPEELEDLKGKTSYSQWEFVYKPPAVARRPGRGAANLPGGPAAQPVPGTPPSGGPQAPGFGGQKTIQMPAARKPAP